MTIKGGIFMALSATSFMLVILFFKCGSSALCGFEFRKNKYGTRNFE
jgi:hypothetical protein